MKLLIIVLSMFNQQQSTNLIDSVPQKHRMYNMSAAEINDSVLLISPIPVTHNPIVSTDKNTKSFHYAAISTVKTTKTETTGNSILMGTFTGLAAGLIDIRYTNASYFGSPNAANKTVSYSGGSLAGVAIGAIIGAVIKNNFINTGNNAQQVYGGQRK